MISEALIKEWKRQAKKDGLLDEYEYHLGMVSEPFPYRLWKMKKSLLDKIQARVDYQEGLPLPSGMMEKETVLLRELGY